MALQQLFSDDELDELSKVTPQAPLSPRAPTPTLFSDDELDALLSGRPVASALATTEERGGVGSLPERPLPPALSPHQKVSRSIGNFVAGVPGSFREGFAETMSRLTGGVLGLQAQAKKTGEAVLRQERPEEVTPEEVEELRRSVERLIPLAPRQAPEDFRQEPAETAVGRAGQALGRLGGASVPFAALPQAPLAAGGKALARMGESAVRNVIEGVPLDIVMAMTAPEGEKVKDFMFGVGAAAVGGAAIRGLADRFGGLSREAQAIVADDLETSPEILDVALRRTERQQPESLDLESALQEAVEAAEGRNLPRVVTERLERLPEPPEGTVRLYRWEGAPARRAGGAGGVEGGTWFEQSPGLYYDRGATPSQLRVLDVPEEVFDRFRTDANATQAQFSEEVLEQFRPQRLTEIEGANLDRIEIERKVREAGEEIVPERLGAESPRANQGETAPLDQARVPDTDFVVPEEVVRGELPEAIREPVSSPDTSFDFFPAPKQTPKSPTGGRALVRPNGSVVVRAKGVEFDGAFDFDNVQFRVQSERLGPKGSPDRAMRSMQEFAQKNKVDVSVPENVLTEQHSGTVARMIRRGEAEIVGGNELMVFAVSKSPVTGAGGKIRRATSNEVAKIEPNRHRLKDAVSLVGGMRPGKFSGDIEYMGILRERGGVGPGNRQFFNPRAKKSVEEMQQVMEDLGYIEADLTPEQFVGILADDIGGRVEKWSDLKDNLDDLPVSSSFWKRMMSEEGSTTIFTEMMEKARAQDLLGLSRDMIDNFARTTKGVLERSGPGGQELSGGMVNYREFFETKFGGAVGKSRRATRALTDVEYGITRGSERRGGNLIDVLGQGHKPMNVRVARAAEEVRSELKKVLEIAREDIGVEVGEIEHFWPRKYERELDSLGKEGPDRFAKAFFRHKRAFAENFLSRETDAMDFRRDRAVLDEYFMEVYQQLSEIKHFGDLTPIREQIRARMVDEGSDLFGERIPRLDEIKVPIDRITAEVQHYRAVRAIGKIEDPGKRILAATAFRRLTGNEQRTPGSHMLSTVRRAQALISLSTSPIAQTSQISHLVSQVGLKHALRGLADAMADPDASLDMLRRQSSIPGDFLRVFSRGAKVTARRVRRPTADPRLAFNQQAFDEALMSGATVSNLRGRLPSAGLAGESAEELRNIGFLYGLPTMDELLRVTAVRSARHYVNALEQADARWLGRGKKGLSSARATLEELGVKGGKATEEDVLRIGKQLSDKTQFRTDVLDMPLGWTNPMGRTVTQFWSFMFRQSIFAADLVKQAQKGNVKPLVRWMASASVMGGVALNVRAVLLGYNPFDTTEVPSDEEAFRRSFSTKRFPPQHPFWRALQNVVYSGGVGVWLSLFESLHRRGGLENFAGPAFSTSQDAYRDVLRPLLLASIKGATSLEKPDLHDVRLKKFLLRTTPTLFRRPGSEFGLQSLADKAFPEDPFEERRHRREQEREGRHERRIEERRRRREGL